MNFRPGPSLTMNNAQTALEAGLRAIAGGQDSIDLGGVASVDSAAVATLLAWRRAAHALGKKLIFRDVPLNLQGLISLYGVDALL